MSFLPNLNFLLSKKICAHSSVEVYDVEQNNGYNGANGNANGNANGFALKVYHRFPVNSIKYHLGDLVYVDMCFKPEVFLVGKIEGVVDRRSF